MKIQKGRGFTLIELMIVIAIIGVLMAIAIPQYQKYVIRSKASQALNALRPIQTTIDEFVTLHRTMPNANLFDQLSQTNTCNGIVSTVGVGIANEVATVTITFHGTAGAAGAPGTVPTAANVAALPANCRNNQITRMPPVLAGTTIQFTGTHTANSVSVDWQITQNGTLQNDYLPVFQSL